MANEHSIRVSARGEFGQLQRGLKQLQSDLKGVLGEIDRGARRGGIFDDSSLRALDIYRQRFKGTLDDINREFEKQNRIIDNLHEKMKQASRSEREDIQRQIDLRERELDVMRRQLFEAERLYRNRNREAGSYGSPIPPAGGGGNFGGGILPLLGGSTLGRLFGAGKFMAGLAGIGGILSMAGQSYNLAYQSRTLPMDLAQRIRGQGGWGGDSYNMWNRAYEIGTRDRMGYTTAETWHMQDMYSRQAGTLNDPQLSHLLKFGRAYGLSTSEVASGIGGVRELGGANSPGHFADMISASVERSGMQPRILEVMETSASLLAELNTTLEDTGAKQILAYQTTLDRIGNENGMMKLTGKQGANIIAGLGGIYDPQSTDWKWMGIQALQRYKPNKYGNMGLYELETSFEDGLLNADNLPAMVKYLREKSGGNENTMKRMLQRWLQSGGYNATKKQVNELYDVTDGFSAFSEDNMKKVMDTLENGDATASYAERQIEIGQQILDVNARFEKQLEELGQPLLELVTNIKEGITEGLEWFTDNNSIQEILQGIFDFLGENWKTLATIGGLLALGKIFGGGIGLLLRAVGGLPLAIGTVIGGAFLLSHRAKQMREEKIQNIKASYKEGYGLSEDQLLKEMGKNDLSWADLEAGVANPKVAKWLEGMNTSRRKKTGIIDENGKVRTSEEWADWANQNGNKFSEDEKKKMQEYLKGLKDQGELDLGELSSSGISSLDNFFDLGTGSLDSFFNVGSNIMNDFFGISEDTFTSLLDTGTKNFESLYNDGSEFLEGVFNEHKGFKEFFAGLWKDFESIVGSALGGFGGGSGGGGFGGGYDVTGNSGVTVTQLNSKLGGKLTNMGRVFIQAGEKYGIDPAFLASIAMHETGNGTSKAIKNKNNVGGMMGKNGLMSFKSVSAGIDAMASNLKRLYIDQGLTTVEAIQQKYAPIGASNDPTGLNSNWTSGVYGFLNGFGVSGNSAMPANGKSFWNNWRSRITSRFGATSGRMRPHSGLDIDGEQGDYLDAVAGGTISKILYDDGGVFDPDGKMNSTSGGSTVMVKMPDGKQYAYAHLSKINPNLRVGQKINAGDYIGNMGGDKGKPGSGYSTTGSHLHLGYYDKNGKALDPMKLLNSLNRGDMDYNEIMNATDGYSLDHTNRSLGDVLNAVTGTQSLSGASDKTVTVNVNLSGDGASKLNNMTETSLKKLIKQVVQNYEEQKLLLNPSMRG